jgi:uncharacterized membrane protein YphA (DoxX/SURF4 family)
MKIILVVLRVFVGLVFVFSAYVKLFPIELFEVAAVETGLVGWQLAPFAARFLIGFELLLGFFLITGFYKKLFIRLSLITLFVFTIHLIYQYFTEGNNNNCNCFGLAWAMTPLQSILKNLILILLFVFLYIKDNNSKKKRWKLYVSIFIALISFAVPYAIAPVVIGVMGHGNDETGYVLDLSIIYNDPDAEQPSVQLSNGKHIVAFLSSSCTHCIVAGYKFSVMKSRHEDIPVFFFINGDESDIDDFHFKSKASHIPYAGIKASTLIYLAGSRLPSIMWLQDGVVIKKTNYFEISEEEIVAWLEEE